MTQIKTKLHREIEKKYFCRKDSLKDAIAYLTSVNANLDEVLEGARLYAIKYGNPNSKVNPFEVAVNIYVSCLKNPKKETD